MLKLTMAFFVATIAWFTTAQANEKIESIVSVTVDCSSSDGDYVECNPGVAFTDVQLVRESSRAGTCVYGSSWGIYDHSIWVNHGCSGRFRVTADQCTPEPQPEPAPQPEPQPTPMPPPPAPAPAPAPYPHPHPHPRLPVADVECRFNQVNWQPFYRRSNHWIGRPGFGFPDANTCVGAVQMSRSNAVCNWVGNGFTPYDIISNREIYFAAYPDLQSCYASLP